MNNEPVSIVKVRNSGGSAAVSIPAHIIRLTGWEVGVQQVLIDYNESENSITIHPVSVGEIKRQVK